MSSQGPAPQSKAEGKWKKKGRVEPRLGVVEVESREMPDLWRFSRGEACFMIYQCSGNDVVKLILGLI